MNRIKTLAASAVFLLTLGGPLLAVGSAQAAQIVLQCSSSQEVIAGDAIVRCDLAVDKQVSVNGGAYQEADTSDAAVAAQVGDTVTYKITVTNNSTDGLTPHGAVYVKDVLPTGVSFVSYTASDGSYTGNDGSYFANDWYLPLLSGGEFPSTTLPATLTITTKVVSSGQYQNTAAFDKYDPGSCDGGCAYVDSVSTNDSNDAWINIPAQTQVLGSSTVTTDPPDTGFGTPPSGNAPAFALIGLGLIGLSAGIVVRRKFS